MNILLWVVQGVVSLKLFSVAVTHGLLLNKKDLKEGIQKMGKPAKPVLYGTAVLNLLGSAGLILSSALQSLNWLTPFIATGLAVLMLLAIPFHLRCRDNPKIFAAIILFVLCGFVAIGRWLL